MSTMEERARKAARTFVRNNGLASTWGMSNEAAETLTTFAQAELERALGKLEKRLIAAHPQDTEDEYDEAWGDGLWEAVNILRTLKESTHEPE